MSAQTYLQGLCKSFCASIVDLVVAQVQCLEGLVRLQEIERLVALAAKLARNAWEKMCKPAAKWGQNASRVCMCRRRWQHVGGVYEDGESNKNQR